MTSLMTRSGTCGADGLERLLAVLDFTDLIAGVPEQIGQVFTHVGVVVGDQHACPLAVALDWRNGRPADGRSRLRTNFGGQPAQGFLHVRFGDHAGDRAGATRPGEFVGRQMGRTEGQPDGERRALALPAVGGDGAAVQADQFFDQGQADSAALRGPRA